MRRYLVMLLLAFATLPMVAQAGFVKVKGGQFERDGKPYYYIGTNFWYGAILGSEGQGGDRYRLGRELDKIRRNGIDNLRVLVGSDGERGVRTKIEPTLQIAPGIYNDTILAGLDYLLKEMGKRHMVAVLYLNNSWEWSGGYSYYLEQAGAGKAPRPNNDGYPAFMSYVEKFASNNKAHKLFYDYVRFMLGRTNRYTGKKYVDDPTIMAWQIGNEPRAFSKEALPAFEKWLKEASALIRSIDKNHLISTGSEGIWGCENDYQAYETICANPNIDYITAHVWPLNWGWAHEKSLDTDLKASCDSTTGYVNKHIGISQKLNKPLVIEEFGYPRDGFSFSRTSSTKSRDTYYKYVFSLLANSAKTNGYLAGVNFWGWGGYATPRHTQWIPGDDYTNDPAQEQQGLNSVFDTDTSTLTIVQAYNTKLRYNNTIKSDVKLNPTGQLRQRLKLIQRKGVMIGHQDDPVYGTTWAWDKGRSDVKEVCGDYPAMMGFELGGLELDSAKNLDGVLFDRMRQEIIAQHERGGVVTISWHAYNPVTGENAWDSSGNAVDNILNGGTQAVKFRLWLGKVATFIKSLTLPNGKRVPVIFRPWHEMSGNWFWWGCNSCTPDEYKELFNYTARTFMEMKVDNALYCYSPGAQANETEEQYMKYYPGDSLVDMLGVDIYQSSTNEQYVKDVRAELGIMKKLATERGKLYTLSETGYRDTPDSTWFTSAVLPAIGGFDISYVLFWRNSWDNPKENFGPAPNKSCAADFRKFHDNPRTLFTNDIKDYR